MRNKDGKMPPGRTEMRDADKGMQAGLTSEEINTGQIGRYPWENVTMN